MIDQAWSSGVQQTLTDFLAGAPAVLDAGRCIALSRPIRFLPVALPFGNATFDRVYCINVLHQFADRTAFFAEARRVLKRGGRLMTIDMDPHADRDELSAAYLAERGPVDRDRFARVRTLRGEMALAGFDWTESMEADHVELVEPTADFRLYATIGSVA